MIEHVNGREDRPCEASMSYSEQQTIMRPNEKFKSTARFVMARWRQRALRSVLGTLARWQPIDRPQEGYSLIIGCASSMLPVLEANLALLCRQERDNLREIILAFDVRSERLEAGYERTLRERYPDLPLRFVYYNTYQAAVLDTIGWAWCYCWMNWVLGIAACRTRHALLHDLDALLLRNDVLEQRYQLIRERDVQYLSVAPYHSNGITPQDNLAATFEMIFDAAWLRERFRPIDLFNKVHRLNGRRVEYDTFLHVQHLAGHNAIVPLAETDMVHPSQLVCQFVELQKRRGYVPPSANNLPLLPYFHYLAGRVDTLDTHRRQMDSAAGSVVPLLGRPMDIRRMSLRHWEWLAKQAERVEAVVAGQLRPEVQAYFQSLRRLVERSGRVTIDLHEAQVQHVDSSVIPRAGA